MVFRFLLVLLLNLKHFFMKLIFMKNWRWLMSSMILGLLLSSCKDDDNTSREYNPNEEVVLTSFNPTKGPLASQVIYMVATLAIIKKL